jgi:hypothetical protein
MIRVVLGKVRLECFLLIARNAVDVGETATGGVVDGIRLSGVVEDRTLGLIDSTSRIDFGCANLVGMMLAILIIKNAKYSAALMTGGELLTEVI